MSTKSAISMEGFHSDLSTLTVNLIADIPQSTRLIKLLALIDRNINNWMEYCLTKTDNLNQVRRHHPNLLKFIVEHYKISDDSLEVLYKLACSGCVNEFSRILQVNNGSAKSEVIRTVLNGVVDRIRKRMHNQNQSYVNVTAEAVDNQRDNDHVSLFTSGANENMSLGNPLGTSRRQRIFFKSHVDFIPTKVVLGVATTIFMGINPSSTIFVAGKFGDEHFMTPHPINLDAPVIHSDIGSSHAVVCCSRFYYAIGDNASNQLGCGTSTLRLSKLTRFELPLLSMTDKIIHCVTSARHTIIATIKDLFVCGSNYGQLGEYAARAFRSVTQPKGFFRMLRPGDPFLQHGGVGVAISDNMTVLYGGNRARVFYEYHEYTISFYNPSCAQSSNVVHAYICRFTPSQSTFVLFFSSVDGGVYIWQRHSSGKSLKPVWTLPEHEVLDFPTSRWRTRDCGRIACGRNGDFYIYVNEYVYKGCVTRDNDGVIKVYAERLLGLPGFVRSVFTSPDAKNLAFVVLANVPADARRADAHRLERILSQRFNLLYKARTCTDSAQSAYLRLISIEAKTKRFIVHRFIIAARAPILLNERWLKDGIVDLRCIDDHTVSELLEFIYTGTTLTFRIAENLATKHMFQIADKWTCDFCGQREPSIHFGRVSSLPFRSGSSSASDLSSAIEEIKCSDIVSTNKELVDGDDLMNKIESRLMKTAGLARDLLWKELQRCVKAASETFAERFFTLSLPTTFLPKEFVVESVFSEEIALLRLECDDGQVIKFPKELLLESPYFETLFRWHDNLNSVRVEDTSTEMLNVVLRFLISRDLDSQLNFEQIVELLFFADRYSFVDLEWEAVYLLEKELHMDNIVDVINLTKTLYLRQLDEAVGTFVCRHWPLFFESPQRIAILDSLPYESRVVVENTMSDFHFDEETWHNGLENSSTTVEFQELCRSQCHQLFGLDINDDTISAEDFVKMLIKVQKSTHKESFYTEAEHEAIPEEFEKDKDVEKKKRKIKNEDDSVELEDDHSEKIVEILTPHCAMKEEHFIEEQPKIVPEGSINTCWKMSTPVDTVPISLQLEQAATHVVSPATRKSWKKHRNAQTKILLKKNEQLDSPKSTCAWNISQKSSPQVVSLGDIMKQESFMQPSTPKSAMDSNSKSPIISSSPNWSKAASSSEGNNYLQPIIKSLSQIQEEEVEKHKERALAEKRRASKPLHCVAVEERAIRELEQYYEMIYSISETPVFFVIRREDNQLNLNRTDGGLLHDVNSPNGLSFASMSAKTCRDLQASASSSVEEHISKTMKSMQLSEKRAQLSSSDKERTCRDTVAARQQ